MMAKNRTGIERIRHRRLAFLATLVVALGAAGAAGLTVGGAFGQSESSPQLSTVTAKQLAEAGITLGVPAQATGAGAIISPSQARNDAVSAYPGATVRETVEAELNDVHIRPAVHTIAYAVSIVPPGGIRAPSAGPADASGRSGPSNVVAGSYLIVFVNAHTGSFIEALSGSAGS